MKSTFLALVILLMACPIYGQEYLTKLTKKFPLAELKEDLHLLKSELEKNHPGLYNYESKSAIDNVFTSIEKSLVNGMTSTAFFRKIAILNGTIKDAHTKIFLPKEFDIARNSILPRFPFALFLVDGKLLILRNLSDDDDIEFGWEIKRINQVPAEEVVEQLSRSLSRDGYNRTSIMQDLNADFSGEYAAIIGCPEEFELDLITKKNEAITVQVKALRVGDIVKNREERGYSIKRKGGLPIEHKIEKETSLLTLRTFDGDYIKKGGQNYKKEFRTIFGKIKQSNIKNLIIDIRDNFGGWPEVADEFLSYLVPTNFLHSNFCRTKVNKIANPQYYLNDGYVKHFEKLKFTPFEDHYKVIWNQKVTKPKKNIFTGKIVVLVNGNSASQSGEFAGLLKDKSNAVFIGEETGGNPKMLSGGDIATLVLPNTKIRVHIPLRKTIINISSENTGYGLKPDFEVKESFQDKVLGHDPVMEYALEFLGRKK